MRSNKKVGRRQKIFIGIDVHSNSWDVTCVTHKGYCKSFNQPPSADALITFLTREFPEGEYHAVYESGFTGFSTYYALTAVGIHTIIANAADVPTTQKEQLLKTDRRDSKKLAESLRAGELQGISIRAIEDLDDRSLVRIRKTFKNEEAATKVRIKHLLYTNGVTIPEQFSRHWSLTFLSWLRQDAQLMGTTRNSLLMLVDHLVVLHKEVLAAGRAVKKMIKSEKYAEPLRRLMTVPGIGINFAVVLLTEIGDFNRFPNERSFACALGLVPMCHDSGPNVSHGEKIFRGNRMIGSMMIEASWRAIAKDAAFNAYHHKCCQRMKSTNAIVKVARRLSNIILSIMKNEQDYNPEKTYPK
ncbi:MAG: IS110 family transposase [Lachnoclostridium sp.]|nr:IS110 family transposase [Lachnoclostridium sp.]